MSGPDGTRTRRRFVPWLDIPLIVGALLLAYAIIGPERAGTAPAGARVAVGLDGDIVLVDADGADREKLTDDPGYETDPVWSPDGEKLAYVLHRGEGEALGVVGADGSGEASLLEGRTFYKVENPAWSPDGERLAFTCGSDVCVADGRGLEVIAPPSGDPGFYDSPDWSPDGGRIAFSCDLAVCVVDADGSGLRRLATEESMVAATAAADADPEWSPDGERIAFACANSSTGVVPGSICVVEEDGSGGRQIADGPGEDGAPEWSPDGERVAFVSVRQDVYLDLFGENFSDLYVAEVGGDAAVYDDEPTLLVEDAAPPVSWSPDGAWVVASGEGDPLFVVPDGSSGPVYLGDDDSEAPDYDGPPAWRPTDGGGA